MVDSRNTQEARTYENRNASTYAGSDSHDGDLSNLNVQKLEHTGTIEANQALFMGTLKLSRTVKDQGRH